MSSIVSTGIGSGLDIDSLVTQLVSAEGTAKAAALTTKEASYTAKLSAFGSFKAALEQLKTALAPLKDVQKFQGRSTSVGDSTVLTVTAGANTVPGSYNVEVERLATAHKLASTPYAAESTVVGTGTLQLTLGSDSIDIVIDSSNNTLAGIRDAINAAAGNLGVNATIVNESGVSGGARLLLSSTKTGAANVIQLQQSGGDGNLAGLVSGLSGVAPVDSRIVIDGFAHESASNTVTSAVDGISFNLLSASEADVTTPVTVSYDKAAASKAVNDFVTAYNSLTSSLKNVSSYNAETKVAGALFGDATLRNFQGALRRELGTAIQGVSSSFSTLAEIGITAQLDGTLAVDSTKLNSALDANFNQVGALFANTASASAPTSGVAKRLDALIDSYTKSDGLIDTRTQGLQSSIEQIADSREALDNRLAALEKRLRAQFNAMDILVAQLKNTSEFLTQQIATLNGSAAASQS